MGEPAGTREATADDVFTPFLETTPDSQTITISS
jgi:hypothetical protein